MNNDLPLYQIADWNDHFENNKSRLRDQCSFVCVPNKHGGSGLSHIMGTGRDGALIYGIWMWIIQLCSRQRRPREGYLTANGKKDGRRFNALELATLFRCDVGDIDLALGKLCSPEVGWMTVVGYNEDTAGAPQGHVKGTNHIYKEHPEDTAGAREGHFEPGHLRGTRGALEGQGSVSSRDTERKKERKNEPPTVPQGGHRPRVTGESGLGGRREDGLEIRAGDGHHEGTGGALEGHLRGTDSDPLQYVEATAWINTLFPGCKKYLSGEEQHLLSDNLPCPRAHQKLLTWAYSLPRDREGWAVHDSDSSEGAVRTSKPKQSRLSLLREFGAEIEKWTVVRKQLGLNGTFESVIEKEEGDGWTPARMSAACELFGPKQPGRFFDLGASACRKVDEKVAAKKTEAVS